MTWASCGVLLQSPCPHKSQRDYHLWHPVGHLSLWPQCQPGKNRAQRHFGLCSVSCTVPDTGRHPMDKWMKESQGLQGEEGILPLVYFLSPGLDDWTTGTQVTKQFTGSLAFLCPFDASCSWMGCVCVNEQVLKSLLQHHSSKASILQCSAFLTVQLSHPYMTTGKTIALTRRTIMQ